MNSFSALANARIVSQCGDQYACACCYVATVFVNSSKLMMKVFNEANDGKLKDLQK